jgi:deoxyribonuclease-4
MATPNRNFSAKMPLLGAHMSIAGGYYKAVESAARCEMNVVQIFTKNNNQWRAKEITDDEAETFKATLKEQNISIPLSHSSYLINLAAPDAVLWKKSIDAMVVELFRAGQLGIKHVVMHPGAFTTTDEATGIVRIAKAIDEVHKQTKKAGANIALENTAGQGSCLGWRFEHLAEIIAKVKNSDRLAVCIDTCHTFAAGYPLGTDKEYKATMKALDRVVGLNRVVAFHLNDSKKDLGSRVDRHEHIGRGKLGLEPFRLLLNDKRFRQVPMYLETPKGQENGEDLDVINLRTLRALVKAKA